MTFLVLVVFFILEVPRILISFLAFTDVINMISSNKWKTEEFVIFMIDDRFKMAAYLNIGTGINFHQVCTFSSFLFGPTMQFMSISGIIN
jgi:hypothetical protein